MSHAFSPDPALDLVLERTVDVPPHLVWLAWTHPEHIKKWLTPAPWTTVECEIELRPGGRFYTLMRSPEGQTFPNVGCYLEVVENVRLAWTNALEPGFRPARPAATGGDANTSFLFTAVIELARAGSGTRYTATAIHQDAAGRDTHERMGFHDGWGKALDQLVAAMKALKRA